VFAEKVQAVACSTCAADLCIDLRVPHGFDSPRKVEPAGATWSTSQSLLRWQLPAVGTGASGSMVAAFRVKDGAEAAAAGISKCYAMLRLQGQGRPSNLMQKVADTINFATVIDGHVQKPCHQVCCGCFLYESDQMTQHSESCCVICLDLCSPANQTCWQVILLQQLQLLLFVVQERLSQECSLRKHAQRVHSFVLKPPPAVGRST